NCQEKYSPRRKYIESSDVIEIPEEVPTSSKQHVNYESENIFEMSVEMARRISSLENVTQFIDEFISKDSADPRETLLLERYSEVLAQERSAGLMAQPAICSPQLAVVSLRPEHEPEDPSVMYFPSCTRIKQCGGCCQHKLLECQPVETEIKTFVVIKSQFTGNIKMPLKEKVPVVVEEHTKCKCDCIVKEQDCKTHQIYLPSQCKCECVNVDDRNKCLRHTSKIWDESDCSCRCRESSKECTTGTYYDENTCGCSGETSITVNPGKQTVVDRKRFILKPISVVQSDELKYQTKIK
ncbi:Vascular endothelial growth factor A, partial [Pseudolycoriella hygida]